MSFTLATVNKKYFFAFVLSKIHRLAVDALNSNIVDRFNWLLRHRFMATAKSGKTKQSAKQHS